MKVIRRLLSLVLILMFFVPISIYAEDYYVSKSGSDSNPGTQSEPFLTISKAASVAQEGDVVNIMGGIYGETLTPANSGTSGKPIVFQAAPGEKVIISAMDTVNGFTHAGGSIYKTTLSWDLGQRMFVMHNNTLLDLARWPNNEDGDRFSLNAKWNTGGSGQDSLSLRNGWLLSNEIPNLPWENGGSLFFFGASRWYAWKFPVTASSSGRVDWESTYPVSSNFAVKAHTPDRLGEFFLEGIKEALDYQNEWYFNSTTKELFVQLPGGVAPTNGSIQVSRRENTIYINNKNYIEIKNLAVIGGSVIMNGNNNTLRQVSSFYGGMSRGSNSKGLFLGVASVMIGWKGNSVYHKNNVIEKCEIAYSDGSAIRVVGENTIVKNNYIHDANYLGTYEAPILARDGISSYITNNTITKGGRDCIQIINKGSEVGYNDISHSNLVADDCGLLYAINVNLNIDIHHNWFHDAFARGDLHKAAGIYLDNDAGNVRVNHNVVWNVEWSNIQMNWSCKDVDIFNNTFLEGSATMGAWHKQGTSFSNVKVWNNLSDQSDWEPQSDKQNNITYTTDPFVDKANDNFMLKSSSVPVDAGKVIPGFTDGYAGSAPDAGAYENGTSRWTPGIDWEIFEGPNGNCYGLPGETCNGTAVAGLSVYPSEVTLTFEGETAVLTTIVSPSDATYKKVIWTSDNTKVATVSESGVVTAVANGISMITATTIDGGYTANVTVTASGITQVKSPEYSFSIHPNPLTGKVLTIDLGNSVLRADISIFDSMGRIVHTLQGGGKLDLSSDIFNSAGLYLFRIKFENGTTRLHKLLVK